MADVGTLRIEHSPAQERYEAILVGDPSGEDEVVGYLDYVSEPYQVVITHTVVREQFSGHGYAAQLVRAVLEDIRQGGKQVVPVCSYVQRFIERHPEFADMAVPVPQ
ncbi:GNAT family N-acetyltransferase [Gordonia sp. 'Campus']|jgi:predicted GNAT family acetyltransferase|uniref:GNAT family N-acetyltransferase n=1 Tax=Gordonia sp. 'Campus' TaxID=2915824 RepID=UPI001EE3C228|nr:GNAT family N-acetyltransferase [Gordonia sp. 'Campus']